MRRVIIFGTALLLFPLLGKAQAPGAAENAGKGTPMTLQECLALGLENNYDLRIVRAEQAITDNDATRGNAGFLTWKRQFPTVETLVSSRRKRSFPLGGDGRFLCGERVSSARGGDGKPVVPYLMRKCQDRNV